MTVSPIEKKVLRFTDKRFIIFFATLAAVFSFFESILPKPFIFVKIGLAYIPILLIIDKINFLESSIIILLKSVITGIFAGTLFSFTSLLSFVGSLGSIFSLGLIYFFINKFSKIAISILLSTFTNLFQLIFYSLFIVKDFSLLKILPLINIISIITGFITAFIALEVENKYIVIEFR